jgi:hypothetical protein
MHAKKTKNNGKLWERKQKLACDWYQASVTSACMKWKTKPRAHLWWRGGEKKTKDEWCMLCSLYNGVSGRCVRIRDQYTACARSNGEMHMHSYHGGYPTISHIVYYAAKKLGSISLWCKIHIHDSTCWGVSRFILVRTFILHIELQIQFTE